MDKKMREMLANLVSNLEKSAEGKAFLSNYLFDAKLKRLPIDVIKTYWKELAEKWHWSDKQTRLVEFIITFAKELELGSPSLSSFYYLRGPNIISGSEECSRIVDANDLIRFNLDFSKTGFAITGDITRQQISIIEKRGLKGIAKGMMRSNRSFAWVTKSKMLYEARRSYNLQELPNVIRDMLGLLHFNRDNHLVEIIYPKDIIKDDLRAPTFIEGNPSLIFRSTNSSDGWGMACDIRTYENGLPEAVHAGISFSDSFTVSYIGRIRPPTPSFDWYEFLKRFVYKWSWLSRRRFEDNAK